MSKLNILIAGLLLLSATGCIQTKEYEPTRESLKEAQVPEWFDDAKFGIMIHWGPYSVLGAVPLNYKGN